MREGKGRAQSARWCRPTALVACSCCLPAGAATLPTQLRCHTSACPCLLRSSSDSIWLSLKSGAPIYVHKGVWEDHSTPLAELQAEGGEGRAAVAAAAAAEAAGREADPMAIRCVPPGLRCCMPLHPSHAP